MTKRHFLLTILVSLLFIFQASAVFAGEIFFKLLPNAPTPEVLAGFEVEPAFQTIKDVYKVTVPEGYEKQYIQWLMEDSNVKWAEENRQLKIKLESTSNDPDYAKQWYIPWIHSHTVIWDDNALQTMAPVTIAVIDSGVDVDHVDLAGNIWLNTGGDSLERPRR